MSRKRMLDPGIWTDEGFLALSPKGRLLWIGQISHADDEGRGCADLRTLRAKIFPGDGMSDEEMAGLCTEVSEHMRVRFYEVDSARYYQLERWANHQFIKDRKASTVPAPDAGPTPDRERTDAGPGAAPNERKKEKKERKECAPSVFLSDKEREDLEKEHGASLIAEAISYLSAYKQAHGKNYKSDAGALRQFGIQAALERREKMRGKQGAVAPRGRKCPKCGEENRHTGSQCLRCGEELQRGKG